MRKCKIEERKTAENLEKRISDWRFILWGSERVRLSLFLLTALDISRQPAACREFNLKKKTGPLHAKRQCCAVSTAIDGDGHDP